MPSIPKQLHFIWIGGSIPEKYLQNIKNISFIAKRSGFELNLWTDKDINIIKSAVKNDISLDGIVIRNIAEVTEDQSIKLDPKYWRDFKKYVQMERSGDFKNLAAAADLLRYAILFKEGGMYIDADTVLHNAIGWHEPITGLSERQRWNVETDRVSTIKYATKHKLKRDLRNYILSDHINAYGFQSAQSEEDGKWSGGNDLLACQKNNHIMENILYSCIDNYRQAEKETKEYNIDIEKLLEEEKQKNKFTITSTLTAKRNANMLYKLQDRSAMVFYRPRVQETIKSNVAVVGQGIERYFKTLHQGEIKDSRSYVMSLLKYRNTLDYRKQELVAQDQLFDIYTKNLNYIDRKNIKLFSMSCLPNHQSEYKNKYKKSYLLLHDKTKPRLYYVNKNGISQVVKLNNFEEFLKRRNDLIGSEDKKYSKEIMMLYQTDVENLITLNGGHSPYKMPLFNFFKSESDQNWVNIPEPKKTAGDTNTIVNIPFANEF